VDLRGGKKRIFEKRERHASSWKAPGWLEEAGGEGGRSEGVFFCNREGKIREEVRIERGKFEAGERTVIENRV
jgi:hypothetical protein